jgi:hypothetical protein
MAEHAYQTQRDDDLRQRRAAERFLVNRPARIIAVNPSLSGISSRSCELLDLSKLGAGLNIPTTVGLPDHYYLNVLGTANRIGCAEVYRKGNRVGVKFIKPIDDELLHSIVRGDFFTRAI